MGVNASGLADHLIRSLASSGVRAARLATAQDVAGFIHSGIAESHLGHIVLITTGGVGIRDFAWGASFEHTLPIATPVAEVATAIIATLGLASGHDTQPSL